jgi:hypothetical protein
MKRKEIDFSRKLIFEESMRRIDDDGVSGYERAIELIRRTILAKDSSKTSDKDRENLKQLISLIKTCTPEFESRVKADSDIKEVIDVSMLPMSKMLLNIEKK